MIGILNIIYHVIAIICIVYCVFHPMDLFSWLWVKGKWVFTEIWDMIRNFIK